MVNIRISKRTKSTKSRQKVRTRVRSFGDDKHMIS